MTTTATALDPKFAKIVALMNSTQHVGERQAARARAEAVAKSCGMTFDEAMAAHLKPAPVVNIFGGFDDHMETKEPGWKARQAAEKAERRRRNAEKRAAVIAKYGSKDAALAPCVRETLILAAVKPWRKLRGTPHERWTHTLDGWAGYGHERHKMPPHVLRAILTAYPLPRTFAEAKAEYEYWEMRDTELGLVLDETGMGYGDTALDYAVGVRAEEVRDLALKEIHVTTVAELYERTKLYRALESTWDNIEDALFRDLEAMAMPKEHLSKPPNVEMGPDSVRTHADHPSTSAHSLVDDMLRADPGRSDRHVARAAGCSPTTVGKLRRSLGLAGVARSVHRRGQIYKMRMPEVLSNVATKVGQQTENQK